MTRHSRAKIATSNLPVMACYRQGEKGVNMKPSHAANLSPTLVVVGV
jgi:hypothetical protein